MVNALETYFAPPERADSESVRSDAQLLMHSVLLDTLTNIVPCSLLVLNEQRQLVYEYLKTPGVSDAEIEEKVLGKRPGELLNCIHFEEAPAGCGTAEACRECGAARAILQAQTQGITAENEVSISTLDDDHFEFRVRVSPFSYENRDFLIVTLLDISDEKRRHALERTFFHDVNSILAVLGGHAQLLARKKDSEKAQKYIETIKSAGTQLAEVITSHRKLLQAENNELAMTVSDVNSLSLLENVIEIARNIRSAKDRLIILDSASDELELVTDRSLLFRVLENMVKNALQAIPEGEEVIVACTGGDSSAVFSVHNPGFIPRPVQLRIFQRSFSTKGRGRGIGTYSMKLFGEKYLKGEVWFTTSEEKGTTFHVSVPLLYRSD